MPPLTPDQPIAAPLALHREPVRTEWIDINNHMNVAYYVLAFDHATDAFVDLIGLGSDHVAAGGGMIFIVESHVTYSGEVLADDPLRFTTQLLAFDDKRIHYVHQMFHETKGYLAATNELMILHVGVENRRTAPIPPAVRERLGRIMTAHADLPRPEGLSRGMGLAKPGK